VSPVTEGFAQRCDYRRAYPASRGFPNFVVPQLQDEVCQCFEHRGLAPVKHWRPSGNTEWVSAVIEIAARTLHVDYGPLGHLSAQCQRFPILLGEIRQSINGLRRALDIYRVSAAVVILRPAGGLEKIVLKEFEAASEVIFKCGVAGAIDVALETIKVVTGMEVIDPSEFRFLCIPP